MTPETLFTPWGAVPHKVRVLFEEHARKAKAVGFTHYSGVTIVSVMRWHSDIEWGKREFKINQNWSTCLCIDLEERCPEFVGFFRHRER